MGTYFSLRPRGHTIKTYYGQSSKYRRFFLEINLRKKKWVISWSYNPHNKIIFSHIESTSRSSHPEVFLEKGVLKIYSKFTGEHPCRSVISTELQSKVAWVFSCKFAVYYQNTFS